MVLLHYCSKTLSAVLRYRTRIPSSTSQPRRLYVHDLNRCFLTLFITNKLTIQPGSIVVNAGDLLARWSNDVLRSTLHRVVAPPAQKISETTGITPARQSIAFFCNPNFDTEISCLPTCSGPGREPKYAPVTTEAYIVGRLQATYL